MSGPDHDLIGFRSCLIKVRQSQTDPEPTQDWLTPVAPVQGYLSGHGWHVLMYRTPDLCHRLHFLDLVQRRRSCNRVRWLFKGRQFKTV